MKKNLIVYKAVFGDYDKTSEQPPNDWECDFLCFTDNEKFVGKGWRIVYVPRIETLPGYLNRYYKMLPHRHFEGYDFSLYLDGNIDLIANPIPLIDNYLNKSSIAIPNHPKRNCSYEEAEHCIYSGLTSAKETREQMQEYKLDGFPINKGLTENGIILRRHNDLEIIELMELWWREYQTKVKRDQISLHYLAWKKGIKIEFIKEGPRVTNKYFHIGLHNNINGASPIRRFISYSHGNQDRSWQFKLITNFVNYLIEIRHLYRIFINRLIKIIFKK